MSGKVPNAGDILFCRSKRLTSRLIRLMDGGPYSHVALAIDDRGTVVEATSKGVRKANILEEPEWEGVEWVALPPPLSEEDLSDAISHARWIAGEGWGYDWVTFFGMALFWSTGGRLMISAGAKAAICSALVADCLHAGGARFPDAIPHFYTPRMLYEWLSGGRPPEDG